MPRLPVFITVALAAAMAVTGGTAAVAEDGPSSTVATGADVSYPQCGRSLPTRGDLAVVGVNAGTGTTTNPCLAEQLAWGDSGGRLADVYVNTANPGHLGAWWPGTDLARAGQPVVNGEGICAGAEDAACGYVYGYSVAFEDVWRRGVSRPGDRTWWLDVETMNSWSWNRGANLAVLEGMAAAIRDAGGEIGLYSTPRQWSLIVGSASPSSALAGTPSWIAGAVSRAGALANCAAAPLTPGGRVRMVQWVQDGVDHDSACEVGVRGSAPAIEGVPSVGSPLVAEPGSWGPTGVRLRYQWLSDGVPIPGADGAAYQPTGADAGTAITVAVTGSRPGAPPLTRTSGAVTVVAPDQRSPTSEALQLSAA